MERDSGRLTQVLNKSEYLEKIVIELHVTEHIASSVCFKVDAHWLVLVRVCWGK